MKDQIYEELFSKPVAENYETIADPEDVCPSCQKKGTISMSVMQEEGVSHPVLVCSSCKWWG